MVRVREAVAEDVPALAELLGQLGHPVAPAVLAERLRRFHTAGELALVAARGGEVVGLVTVHVTPVLHRPTAVGRLTALVVAEGARGGGVGRALVAAAEERLAARGCALVEVTSNRRRTDAHAFYERLGYEVTSLRFWKRLDSAGGEG